MDGQFDIGMVGLGVMGRNFVLNIADHGHSVAGYDKNPNQIQELRAAVENRPVHVSTTLADFTASLKSPRTVMMLVPAGPPVDAVIRDLLPYLEAGDTIIDGGNSHFTDTNLRAKTLAGKGINFLGIGISGGESGARHGPSLMPGGPQRAYEHVRSIFESAAAQVNGEPCVAYLGPDSAGHYVKMIHNGIEYAFLELIAESYSLMKVGLGLTDEELHQVYDRWNHGQLNSYLIEITARIFQYVDDKTGQKLIDVILDEAHQKGTGKWTSQDGMDLQVPLPVIDASVSMRDLTALKEAREAASRVLKGPSPQYRGDKAAFINHLQEALYAGLIISFAQGMALLFTGSHEYEYHLNLESVAKIWRGGCIIRASLLEDIRSAYRNNPALSNLLMDARLGSTIMERQSDLRSIVRDAVEMGISIPGFMAALAYYDGYRSAWLPANLIQAQRDYFGAHTYERVDAKGVFHTHWGEE
ncbi:MAG: NADP-dependent phosphogluconate dehydrogenase [Anaerolineaceae bacterium]|nr:NADP-dependent phosphogluconate dehydrogenase [Anaerolineaceae bacterium]